MPTARFPVTISKSVSEGIVASMSPLSFFTIANVSSVASCKVNAGESPLPSSNVTSLTTVPLKVTSSADASPSVTAPSSSTSRVNIVLPVDVPAKVIVPLPDASIVRFTLPELRPQWPTGKNCLR